MNFLQTKFNLRRNRVVLAGLCGMFLLSFSVNGATYSSTNYTIENPTIGGGGLDGSSASFQVLSAVGQTGEGLGTSASYELRSGVLYFAELATAPVITVATAGVEQVSLTWSAASGNVAVADYELGVATSSGAQTYTSVGNVLSAVSSGLVGGTTYYFKIRAVDSTGTVTATSAEVSATPTASTPAGGGSGPGGGVVIPVVTPPDGGDENVPPDTEQPDPPEDEEEQEDVLPVAPTALGGQAINAGTIRWAFRDNADNEDGFVLEADGLVKGSVGANSNFIDEAVTANTWHEGRQIYAQNSVGLSEPSQFLRVHALIESPVSIVAQNFGVPNALQLRAVSAQSVFTNLNLGQSAIEFVDTTQNTSSGWVKTDNIIVSGLAKNRPYTFVVRARNAIGQVTPFSSPFTFVLPADQIPGEEVPPGSTTGDDDEGFFDQDVDENFELEVIYPENGNTVTGGTVEVKVRTVPFAVVSLQVNITSATALADSNGEANFVLRNLPNGQYLLVAVATAQSGVRSTAVRQNFFVVNDSTQNELGAENLPATITPIAPITPPPPTVIQPPLTEAVIVSEVTGLKPVQVCDFWCSVRIALFIILYIASLLTLWYVIWWYINRPLSEPKIHKKRRK